MKEGGFNCNKFDIRSISALFPSQNFVKQSDMKTRIRNNSESAFSVLKQELYSQLILVGFAVFTSLVLISILAIID
jgi:hypothetical protein